MKHHQLVLGIALLLALAIVQGCGRTDVEESEPELPDWLTQEEPSYDAETITLAAATTSTAPALERTALQLSLNPGDRFPLRRVVDQELEQASLTGVPEISRSHLELLLSITVEDVQPDRKRFDVRYDRVRYSHDIFGDVVEYDSAAPPAEIPAAALAYHAMLNDGFAFEQMPDPQLARGTATKVDGFREFLERCLGHVPEDQRQRVLLDIEASSGEKLVAEFVNHTIGLLPDDGGKALGETWEKNMQIFHPLPMQMNTVYTLKGLSDGLADIGITGTITPLTLLGQPASDDQGVKIIVQGGHCEGHCTIDRASGLPTESHIERTVNMSVQTGGLEFTQQKRTTTTVESLPGQAAAPAAPAATAADTNVPRFQ